ncbi:M23 family metallopeptidase [Paenibacillus sp. IB182496]|uniref:M23 family metallopeptidase n=1 Tax=Paenibacillus sabuli TaxID=2772509 RepID=A0A927BX76_9BACL|nr:M23 family metallopeptidase [Paenibacillus sabuli]MBD2846998.1 M23 family metallopeptidase [Paenibacillus sabuli]
MKKIIVSLFLLSLLATPFVKIDNAKAADYDRVFAEVYGLSSYGSTNGRSPIRSGSSDVWARVNSKTNQPRSSGTNPHQGADLQASAGTLVYPILPGKVVAVQHNTSSQLGSVTLNHDIDGDGIYDNYYVRYLHIDPNGNSTTGISVGDTFSVNQSIGTIDTYKVYPPHLHFHRTNSISSLTYKLYGFYRSVSTWNFGSHLDFISGDAIVTNTLYINAYAATDNSTNIYDVSKIELYYKVGWSGSWAKSTTPFTISTPSYHRWKIDLKSATGAASGDFIYYYLVAYRSTDPTFSGSYKTGFWPQYYEHPTAPLTSSRANTIYRSFIIE